MKSTTLILSAIPLVASQSFPAKGDGTFAGGIFSISLPDLAGVMAKKGASMFGGGGSEAPRGKSTATTQGTGPYPAKWFSDPSIPNHVVYAPIKPPNVKMPFIAWGNGACGFDGTGFKNFLTEIASHGYVVSADGPAGGAGGSKGILAGSAGGKGRQSKVSDMRDSIDWAMRGGAKKYGDIDTTKIIAAGQSCGGLEAYSVSYRDPRIKWTMHFNIGIFQDNKRYLLKELKVPAAWFLGGPKDIGFDLGNKDYAQFPAGIPAYKASLDTGHLGTYFAPNGGKFGKAAVAYLQWQTRGDAKSKAMCLEKGAGSLTSDRWNVTHKNWK